MSAERTHKKAYFFEQDFGGVIAPLAAIYDERDISDREVKRLVEDGGCSPYVILATQDQFQNIFRDTFAFGVNEKGVRTWYIMPR